MSGMEIVGLKFVGDATQLNQTLSANTQAVQAYAKGVQTSLDKSGQSMLDYGQGLRALMSGPAVLGTAGIGAVVVQQMGAAILDAQVKADKLRNTLISVVGGTQVASEMRYLRDTTQTLGLEFTSTAQQYARLSAAAKGTSLEGRGVKEVFEAVSQASVVLGLGAEESEGALRAVQQMMSKGKVQAEELRGQLGERLPGAFQIAARAMGVTTGELDKMLERGEVFADDFLPRFAAELKKSVAGGLDEAVNSAQASINRFSNSWMALKESIAASGVSSLITAGINTLGSGLSTVSQRMNESREAGSGMFSQLISGFGASGAAVLKHSELFNLAFGQQALYPLMAYQDSLSLAQTRLKNLNGELEKRGPDAGFYLRNEIAQTQLFIQETQAAMGAQLRLRQLSSSEGYDAKFTRMGAEYRRIEQQKSKDEAFLGSLRQRVSGQSEKFQSNLKELKEIYDRGVVGQAEYNGLVKEMIKKDGGVSSGGAKAATESVYQRMNESIGKKIELTKAEIEGENKLSDAEKYRLQTLREINHELELKKLKPAEAKTLRERVEAAALEMRTAQSLREQADARQKNEEARSKAQDEQQKEADALIKENQTLREQIELVGASEEAQRAIALARIDATIATKEQERATLQNVGGMDIEISKLEQQIELLRQKRELTGNKFDLDAQKKKSDADNNERDQERKRAEQRTQTISESIADGMVNGFGKGKSIADIFLDELKKEFARTVLMPTIKPAIDSIFGGGGLMDGIFKGSGSGGGFAGGFPGLTGPLFGGSGDLDPFNLISFDGGGSTGNAARSGGLDGKGGFLAMMHPQEKVTDLTKGGGASFAPQTSIVINGGGADVRSLRQEFSTALNARDEQWRRQLSAAKVI